MFYNYQKMISGAGVFLFSLFCTAAIAQFQQGPLSSGAGSNGTCSFSYSSSLHLSPAANTAISDDVYATASHCACCDANTSCLRVEDFGFTIPPGATITGILVEVEKRASPGSNIQDNGLRIIKNGAEAGPNRAQLGVSWPFSDTYVAYGGPNDLWGTTWTPADINATDFGVTLASIDYSCAGTTTSYIDHIRILVYYDDCNISVTSAFSSANSLLSVAFTDQSTNATSWEWNFGDGTTSTQQNPTHVYSDTGSYTVCLVAFDACGSDTSCVDINVCFDPLAGFDFLTNNLSVGFSDTSDHATSWEWNFGDGTISTQQNPIHVYSDTGSYTVCLVIFNNCGGSDTVCSDVRLCYDPVAGFSANASNLIVTFSDLSTDATSWAWDFGDGNTSVQQAPAHTYAAPGTYTVCLVAGNDCASDTICNDVILQTVGIAGDVLPEITLYPNPVKDAIYLTLSHDLPVNQVEILLFDNLGKAIALKNLSWNNGTATLDVSALPSGVYCVNVSAPNFSFTRKVVVSK